MTSYEQALLLLALPGALLAAYGLYLARRIDKYERRIAERKAAQHAAE